MTVSWALSDHVDMWSRYCADVKTRLGHLRRAHRNTEGDAAFKRAVLADIEDHSGLLTDGVIEFKSQEHLTAFVLKYS